MYRGALKFKNIINKGGVIYHPILTLNQYNPKYIEDHVEKPHIDICLPFFNRNDKDSTRYLITKKIFKHYKNIKQHFQEKAYITFTCLGSEFLMSKELVVDTLGIESYYDFEQTPYNKFDAAFYEMLYNKVKTSFKISISKSPDITFFAGSNDFIPFDFFEQVISSFHSTTPQIYGIGNNQFANGCVFMVDYDGGTLDFEDGYYWDGIYHHGYFESPYTYYWDGVRHDGYFESPYNYCSGIIGINKLAYLKYNVADNWGYDERKNELMCYETGDIKHASIKNAYYLNIKNKQGNDISNFNEAKQIHINTNVANLEDKITDTMKKQILSDIEYFNNL
jgi:hypothetical protein